MQLFDTTSKTRGRSTSRSKSRRHPLKEQVATLIDGLGALQSQVSTLLTVQTPQLPRHHRHDFVSFADEPYHNQNSTLQPPSHLSGPSLSVSDGNTINITTTIDSS